MNEKTDAQVVIGGRTYTLSGYESEEYLLRVAEYLNGKIDELRADPDYGKLPVDLLTKKRMISMISNTNSWQRR